MSMCHYSVYAKEPEWPRFRGDLNLRFSIFWHETNGFYFYGPRNNWKSFLCSASLHIRQLSLQIIVGETAQDWFRGRKQFFVYNVINSWNTCEAINLFTKYQLRECWRIRCERRRRTSLPQLQGTVWFITTDMRKQHIFLQNKRYKQQFTAWLRLNKCIMK